MFQTEEPGRSPHLLRPSIQCPASERSQPLPLESHAAVAAKLGVQNQHRPSPERRRRDASLRKARLHRSPSRRRRLLCNVCHLRASHLSPLRGIRWSEANAGTCSSYLVRFATRVLAEVTQRRLSPLYLSLNEARLSPAPLRFYSYAPSHLAQIRWRQAPVAKGSCSLSRRGGRPPGNDLILADRP